MKRRTNHTFTDTITTKWRGKSNKEGGNKPLNDKDLRPTVRFLLLLAVLKLTAVIGLAIVVSQQGEQLETQGEQLKTQSTQVDNINDIVENVTSDEANRAQQIILYKIFLAQCEGRQLTNPSAFASTGDKTVEECATRLFLARPQLPAEQFVVPTNENDPR